MELTNEFRVGVPIGKAWEVLTDVELIAPCLPGAELQEVEGEEYRGIVKVKVGPITAQYKGAAHFVEKDAAAHRAVLRAEGRDTRGQGNANATITATLKPDGDGTHVSVVTDLAVTGKVAQFGRGVLAEVSAKLLDQFVAQLEATVLSSPPTPASSTGRASRVAETGVGTAGDGTAHGSDAPAPAPVSSGPATPPAPVGSAGDPAAGAVPVPPEGTVHGAPASNGGARRIDSSPAEPVDLLDAAGGSVLKRAGPIVGGLVVFGWMAFRWRRRHR